MKKRGFGIFFFILILTFSALLFTSCGNDVAKDKFKYANMDFKVEISGFIDGNKVSATFYSTPSAPENGTKAMIKFHSPKALDGVVVSLSNTDEYGARLGSSALSGEWARGLFEPFFPIFQTGEIYSVQKSNTGEIDIRICDENCDLTYVFFKNSEFPSRIFGKYSGRDIDFTLQSFDYNFDSAKQTSN